MSPCPSLPPRKEKEMTRKEEESGAYRRRAVGRSWRFSAQCSLDIRKGRHLWPLSSESSVSTTNDQHHPFQQQNMMTIVYITRVHSLQTPSSSSQIVESDAVDDDDEEFLDRMVKLFADEVLIGGGTPSATECGDWRTVT